MMQFVAALLAGGLAQAPSTTMICASYPGVVAELEARYAEVRIGQGLTAHFGGRLQPGGVRTEIWASSETGTWTMVVVGSGGVACIVGDGSGWEAIP
jgi:hypothetical protein